MQVFHTNTMSSGQMQVKSKKCCWHRMFTGHVHVGAQKRLSCIKRPTVSNLVMHKMQIKPKIAEDTHQHQPEEHVAWCRRNRTH